MSDYFLYFSNRLLHILELYYLREYLFCYCLP